MKKGYMVSGLPGAGKSTVSDIGVELTDGDVVRMGQMVRQMAYNEGMRDPTSDELGEFAAQLREDEGPAALAERIVGMILRGELDVDYPLFVDGVRHRAEVIEFREFFDQSFLLWVSAPSEKRLGRLQSRGRDSEAAFTEKDLVRRDEREKTELGTATVMESDQVDYSVENNATEDELRERLGEIL